MAGLVSASKRAETAISSRIAMIFSLLALVLTVVWIQLKAWHASDLRYVFPSQLKAL